MNAQTVRIFFFVGLPLLVAATALGFALRGDGVAARAMQAAEAGAPVPDPIHDPSIAKAGGLYYVYSTGRGVPIHRSRDLIHWQEIGRVFADDVPTWAKQAVPKSGNIWAPDISYFGGLFHLYYAVSSFGSNHSVIGLATNTTLDPDDKNYRWVDQGKVFESLSSDGYNAIDPNAAFIGPDRVALVFGSFWSGVKLVPLDSATGRPVPGAPITPLAQRPPPDALGSPVHRPPSGLFLPVRLVRLLLPGHGQHLQHPRGTGQTDHRSVCRPGRKANAVRRPGHWSLARRGMSSAPAAAPCCKTPKATCSPTTSMTARATASRPSRSAL